MDASLNGDDEDDFMGLEEFDPTVELYECETDRWRYLSPLPNGAGRSQHAATSISDTKVSSVFFYQKSLRSLYQIELCNRKNLTKIQRKLNQNSHFFEHVGISSTYIKKI